MHTASKYLITIQARVNVPQVHCHQEHHAQWHAEYPLVPLNNQDLI